VSGVVVRAVPLFFLIMIRGSPTCSRKKWNRGAGVAYKTLYQCARKNMKIMYHQLWLLSCMNAICLCADIFANYSMTVDMDPKKISTRPQLNIEKISAFQKPQDFEQSSALLSILPLMSTFFFSNKNSCLPLYILLGPNFFYKAVSLPNHKPTDPTSGSTHSMRVGIMITRKVNDA